jgi:hypothetical protein
MTEQRINLDHLKEVAIKGVRRAALFLGLGLNAANREDFRDYELWKVPEGDEYRGLNFSLIPDNAGEDDLRIYKDEFGCWVINNGLRELVERFVLFLDQAHHLCLFVSKSFEGNRLNNHSALQTEFVNRPGMSWKLRTLKERFGIEFANSELLETLYDARNCLSHRLGVVLNGKDCGEDGLFHLKWVGVDVFIRFTNGVEHPIGEMIGVVLEEPGEVCTRISERTLSFRHGEVIRLHPKQLAEMCFFVQTAVDACMASLIAYFQKLGIEVNQKVAD